MPHLTETELHSIGLAYYNEVQPPALLHNMSHLTSGVLVDPMAYKMGANLSDPVLVLERDPTGLVLVRRARPAIWVMRSWITLLNTMSSSNH